MEVSYKFKHIEDNLVKLLEILLQNENLKKYIVHLVNEPLNQPNVTQDLIESGHIVLNLFDEGILSDERVTVFINPYEGNLKSQPLSNLTFTVDIIVPYSKWLLNTLGQVRAFRIADEISKDIDQQKVMGIGDTEVGRFKIYKVNKNYSGLTLWISVNSSTMKGLR